MFLVYVRRVLPVLFLILGVMNYTMDKPWAAAVYALVALSMGVAVIMNWRKDSQGGSLSPPRQRIT